MGDKRKKTAASEDSTLKQLSSEDAGRMRGESQGPGDAEDFHRERLISIGRLSAGIVHEINNPLSFILGNFTALMRYFQELRSYITKMEEKIPGIDSPESRDEMLKDLVSARESSGLDFMFEDIDSINHEVKDGFHRIQAIISSLSEFSRGETNSSARPCRINDILDSTLNVIWNKLKYSAELEKDYGEDLPEIHGIRNEIAQALMNVLINAGQAIAEKNEKVPGRIGIVTRAAGDGVDISISDSGVGITAENLTEIFKPFFTTKESGKGTGLGLSISNDIIVKRHNGSIEVESEPGEGSVFRIHLPEKAYRDNDE